MHVLSLWFKLREQLTPYPGGLKGFLRAPRSQNVYFVDLREDFTSLASHVISVNYLYTHFSAILSEPTVFCVTGGHRG